MSFKKGFQAKKKQKQKNIAILMSQLTSLTSKHSKVIMKPGNAMITVYVSRLFKRLYYLPLKWDVVNLYTLESSSPNY